MMEADQSAKGKKPDNISTHEIGGVIYAVHEYFAGTKSLEEIVAQRVLRELHESQNNIINPSISSPQDG